MAFDIEGPQKALDKKSQQIWNAEKELEGLKEKYPAALKAYQENAARARMDGIQTEKPAELTAIEARVKELEEFLPAAKAVLHKDKQAFANKAGEYLFKKQEVLAAEVEAKLKPAYDAVAAALIDLAEVIGKSQTFDLLNPGEHARFIRERLIAACLPELGLRKKAELLKSMAEQVSSGKGANFSSQAAYFQD